MTGRDDLIDERGPVVRPFLLQDRDQDEVELIQKGTVPLEHFLRLGVFDDQVDHEIPDSYEHREQAFERC